VFLYLIYQISKFIGTAVKSGMDGDDKQGFIHSLYNEMNGGESETWNRKMGNKNSICTVCPWIRKHGLVGLGALVPGMKTLVTVRRIRTKHTATEYRSGKALTNSTNFLGFFDLGSGGMGHWNV
jgi:hypothetical protein